MSMINNEVDILCEVTPEILDVMTSYNDKIACWYNEFPYATSDDPCSKGLSFMMGKAPYDNVDFRWGITLAMNFDEISMNIFDGVGRSARIAQEEIFGPVLAVQTFDGEEEAVAIANDLMKNGTVTDRAQLGITLQTIPDSAAQYYNMPDGAYVNAVNSGSCAEKAGLKAGDIITAIDGTAVSSGDALRSALRGYSAGESATLTVSRSGETLKLTVTFDRASDSTK